MLQKVHMFIPLGSLLNLVNTYFIGLINTLVIMFWV